MNGHLCWMRATYRHGERVWICVGCGREETHDLQRLS